MNKPKIIAYLKPTCGWSQGVRAIMRKYDLPYEDRDIINDPAQRQEMIEKSGQMLSPCVEITGVCSPTSAAKKWKLISSPIIWCRRTSAQPTLRRINLALTKCLKLRRCSFGIEPNRLNF